jgi:hypothetical protein
MSEPQQDQTVFDGDWLSLREPADHAARDERLLEAVRLRLREIENPRVVDLAAGRGSTIAAIDPGNELGVQWHLRDQDVGLLRQAKTRFADHGIESGPCDLRTAVLSADQFGDLVPAGTDLVTLSAFVDLVSLEWLAHFALRCSERALPVYCALTIDGRFSFDPVHPSDEAFLTALATHEQSDKGFGPALGPHAPQVFNAAFGRAGYVVDEADSDWVLSADDAPLIEALIEGWVGAVMQSGLMDETELIGWVSARLNQMRERSLRISLGHKDMLARPPRRDVTKL